MKSRKQYLIRALGVFFLDSFKNFFVLWSLLKKRYNHIHAISLYWNTDVTSYVFTSFFHRRTDTILQEFSVWCGLVMGVRISMHSQYYIKTELLLYKWAVTVCLFSLSLHHEEPELFEICPNLAKAVKGYISQLAFTFFPILRCFPFEWCHQHKH